MISIFQNPSGSAMALVNPQESYYLVQMIGKVSRKSYQDAFMAVIKDAKESQINHLVINVKEMSNNPDMGRQWLTTFFMRRFYKINGSFRMALVTSQNQLERASVGLIYSTIEKIGVKVSMKFFNELPSANRWLKEKEKGFKSLVDDFDQYPAPDKKVNLLSGKKGKFKVKLDFSPKGNFKSDADFINLPSLEITKGLKKITNSLNRIPKTSKK